MRDYHLIASGVFLGLVVSGATLAAQGGSGKYAGEVKITLSQARATALKIFPGKIISEELEEESGGSGLRYSFDIQRGKLTHEVGVDAITGKALENSVEGPHVD